MDEYTDLYDDNDITEDAAAGDTFTGSWEEPSGDDVEDPSIEDVIRDVLDDYFGTGEEDPVDGEENGEDADAYPETDDEMAPDAAAADEGVSFDTGILDEINNNLQQHVEEVSGFISNVTVSGNAVMVSLDGDSSALLNETIAGQAVMSEQIDHMTGLIVLVLFVLLFDLIHRFARRTIKNFMRRGEKNATNS